MRPAFAPDEKVPPLYTFVPQLQQKPEAVPELTQALDCVKRVLRGELTFLTLSGPYGTGKSHLLKAAVVAKLGYYITAYDFDKRIKDFRKSAENQANDFYIDPDEWLDRLAALPFLAIDDIGAGYIDKGWTQSRFERLVDMRHRAERSTLFSTNMLVAAPPNDEFRREMGPRIWDRLFDGGLPAEVGVMRHADSIRDIRGV